jgi:hypothetical protein
MQIKCFFMFLLLLILVVSGAYADLTSVNIGQLASAECSTQISAGTYTIKADGRDIWESWDDFRFVYREIYGDFEAVVRVVSFEPTHESAKVGLMARQSTEPGSSFAFSLVTPWHGALLHWRLSKDTEAEGSWGDIPVNIPQR